MEGGSSEKAAGAPTSGTQPDAAVSRRDLVRRLGLTGAVAAAGIVVAAAPAAADPLVRTQPRRFRLAPPPVTADTPASAPVNKGYVEQYIGDNAAPMTLAENVQAGSYTLGLSDAAKVVAITSSSAATVTVPKNSSVAFPTGTVINVYRAGSGAVTIAPASGVTIRNAGAIADQYAEVSLRKRGTDEWVLSGNIA